MANLGTLTLDLVAKTANFVQGMTRAERQTKQSVKEIERSLKSAEKAIKAFVGALAVGATFTKIINETKAFQEQQAQLAAVLKSTGEAAGYSQVQLNEMADSLSKSSTESAGNINKAQTALLAFTGIVGDEYPRALQAAADMSARTGMQIDAAAETIGRALDVPSQGMAALSRQGFRFTDAQKEIVKHLEETGRAADAQGIILDALEESYGGAAQAARDTLGGALAALRNEFDNLLTGPESTPELTAAINELTNTLADPRIKQAFGVIVAGVVNVTAAIAKALPEIVGFTTWAAEELAHIRVGAHPGDITRLESDAEKIKGMLDGSLMGLTERLRFFGKDGIVKLYNRPELESELSKINADIKSYYNRIEKPVIAEVLKPAAIDQDALAAEAAAAKEAERLRKERERAEIAAGKRSAAAAARAAQQEQARLKALADEIVALQRLTDVWGMSEKEVQLYDYAVKGATSEQLEHAASLLTGLELLEDQKKAQEKYNDLIKSLRTDEEQRTDTLREQLAIIRAAADIPQAERDKAESRAVQEAIGADDKKPKFSGAYGAMGELFKFDQQEKDLNKWYEKRLEMLDEFREQFAEKELEWDEAELEAKQHHIEQLQAIDDARRDVLLASTEQMLGNAAALTKQFAGENSKAYKAMFIAEKTAGAARAAVAVATGIAQAAANPWPLNIAAIASTIAATAGLVANVSAIGMAHDGIDSIPKTGTWILEKGERVMTSKTSAKLDGMLEGARNGGGLGGGGTVNQTINVTGTVDRYTAGQLARQAAQRQSIAEARLG